MLGSMPRSNLAKGARRCKCLGDPSAAKPETPLVAKGRKAVRPRSGAWDRSLATMPIVAAASARRAVLTLIERLTYSISTLRALGSSLPTRVPAAAVFLEKGGTA